ncbi:Protease Do-like 14-like protein [Heracleum sosnowskyi]|uniref:Protease Do-like 14-like protein n=1 Tax=Heracleum sosnowskyi TaxID=360622 RepID=A0AAD8H956_9APIA|nr:Protease Do-like 14-like protein [Heracleum sosnowskyi]
MELWSCERDFEFMGKGKGKMLWARNPSSISNSPDDEEAWSNILDIEEKRVTLEVSPSVVALVSYAGDEKVTEGSGTIIESNNDITIVLTSANLVRRSSGGKFMKNDMINDLKIIVDYRDGQSYTGEIFAFDYHFNLAAISFRSQVPLPTAKIGEVDDSLDVLPSPLSSELIPHSYKLSPEAKVFAVGRMGRFSRKPFAPIVASGAYWVGRCGYDCKELFKASCKIRECGEGGPLVNHLGEVIGITYYDFSSTPCMPISISHKWWQDFKTHRYVMIIV